MFVMVRLVVGLRVVGLRLVVGRSWFMIYWRWRWVGWSWFMISWNRSWFMIHWRWGVRCWRVCWWRHWGVLSLSSDLLTDRLDREAVEGGEVLLAVSFSSHEGQEGEGSSQW